TPTVQPPAEPEKVIIALNDNKNTKYAITFDGRTGNTWHYTVYELRGRDLSHWDLGIGSCLDRIVNASPGGAEMGVDGSTGFYGIKWDVSDGFSSGSFAITLDGDYPAGTVEALVKGGPNSATGQITGPICDDAQSQTTAAAASAPDDDTTYTTFATYASEAPDPGPVTIELLDNKNSTYEVTMVQKRGNTWTYRVREVRGRDLSHWNLGIGTCLDHIVSTSPGGAEMGTDGSTGFYGIKWDVSDSFEDAQFSITLDADYPAGTVEVLAKAGTKSKAEQIMGPICDGSVEPVEEMGPCLDTIDFETNAAGSPLSKGQIIDEEWAAWGIHVTTDRGPGHPAMIFDSTQPSGGDADLGTPNEDFGGPGDGEGGGVGEPGENNRAQGKVLIISEDGDMSDPDDNGSGGTILFTFDHPVQIDQVHILDIDDDEAGGWVAAYSDSGGQQLLTKVEMLGLGDNSFQVVPLYVSG
ncbi:hypothetical protein RY27_05845, partial [Litorilinea aerophila]